MEARMPNVYKLARGGYLGLTAVEDSLAEGRLPRNLLELIRIRASQINGCSVCTDMHSHRARKEGESDQRLWSVATWRDTPFFSDAERAALALTEAITRVADNSGGVPDDVWRQASDHFGDEDLAALVMAIASVNAWNRINIAARLVAGTFR